MEHQKSSTIYLLLVAWIFLAFVINSFLSASGIVELWQLVTPQVFLWVIYAFLVWKIYRAKNFKVTERKISYLVIIVFFIWFFLASIAPLELFGKVPELKRQIHSLDYSLYWQTYPQYSSLPGVVFLTNTTITTVGDFSVNNPITVHVTIFDANVSDLLSYYDSVGFQGGYMYNKTDKSIDNIGSAALYLTETGDNVYEAEATLVFLAEGPVIGPLLLPIGPNLPPMPILKDIMTTDWYISSVANTLAILYTQTTLKVAWQIGAFSVIALQPALVAILMEEKPLCKYPKRGRKN